MKVLILCMNGITTTMFCRKMEKYAKYQGFDDVFMASAVRMDNLDLRDTDVIFWLHRLRSIMKRPKKWSKI
ncbi:MAG: hypothetical protein Q4D13_04500 [Erysipelotrichaceae bacterium]|nr:hypothetical protein [Erysipelotrichaceae bacterium]